MITYEKKKMISLFVAICFRDINMIQRPEIGGPHFCGLKKQIRSENISFESAILDILDNVYGQGKIDNECYQVNVSLIWDEDKNLHRIKIQDNVRYGFRDIMLQGVDNPFNFTHVREGHSNDAESSEFGIGLKKSAIYLGRELEVYTRSVDRSGVVRYIFVKWDFVEMVQKEHASDSYSYKFFQEISEDEMKQFHPIEFSTGSTLIINSIYSGVCEVRPEVLIERLKKKLREAYSDILGNYMEICLDGTLISPSNVNEIESKIPEHLKIEFRILVKMSRNMIKSVCVYRRKNREWKFLDIYQNRRDLDGINEEEEKSEEELSNGEEEPVTKKMNKDKQKAAVVETKEELESSNNLSSYFVSPSQMPPHTPPHVESQPSPIRVSRLPQNPTKMATENPPMSVPVFMKCFIEAFEKLSPMEQDIVRVKLGEYL